MPARSTGGENNVVEAEQFLISEIETTELRCTRIIEQAATHRVFDCLRLLKNLLEHEVRISASLDLPQVPVHLAHTTTHFACIVVEHAVAVSVQHRDVAVIQIHHLASVRQDGRHIARNIVLSFTQPEQQRTALTRRDELVWIATRYDGNAVRALDL